MKLKKLPLGIQTFNKIRKNDYLYIDKTEDAYNLINNYSYAFLSRPRRFGKSLFLDTLKNIFEGNKEYFKDLYIYDKWNWDIKYPVIKISWGGADYQTLENLEAKINKILFDNQERLGIKCQNKIASICLEELIQKAYKKYNQQVVILVDEYDKPILNTIDNLSQAKINREKIKGIYEVLKDNDEYIKFAFLTGVSKFSKASIFSGLNMLSDISLDDDFGNICGYTQKNIENEFKNYLKDVDLDKLKSWYNGYNFLKDDVYNPFDILQFITKKKRYSNYWFETGTPTLLIKLIKENNYFLPKLTNLTIDEKLLNSFDIENIDLEVILYQAGYLTIDKIIEKRRGGIEYKLKIPNQEVKASFGDILVDFITNQEVEKIKFQNDIYDALYDIDLNLLKNTLKSIFASIPYNNLNYIKNYEGYYASVIYVYLQSLGITIIGEDVTNKGRIDLTCFINNIIYIIEFKVDSNKGDAISQIKNNKYYEKYLNQNKDIYLIGIEFSSKDKNISNFQWEKLIKQ